MPDYMTVCEQAARAAGATLVDWMGKFSVREKGLADLVTEADFAAQETVRRIVLGLPRSLPPRRRGFAWASKPKGRTEYRWVVDPLDGTTNYVHGIPHFAVSLALEAKRSPARRHNFRSDARRVLLRRGGRRGLCQRQPHPRQRRGRDRRGGLGLAGMTAGREAGFARPAGLRRKAALGGFRGCGGQARRR